VTKGFIRTRYKQCKTKGLTTNKRNNKKSNTMGCIGISFKRTQMHLLLSRMYRLIFLHGISIKTISCKKEELSGKDFYKN